MRKLLPFILVFVLAACSSPVVSEPTSPPTEIISPTETTLPPTLTVTETVMPTETLQPTETPIQLEPINASTIGRIGLIAEARYSDLREVVFSPDGAILAAASGNNTNFQVRLIEVETVKVVRTLDAFTNIVWSVAFTPDGNQLAAVSKDDGGHTLRIFNVADGALLHIPESMPAAICLAFSPDGSQMAVGGLGGDYPQGAVWLYDTATWQVQSKVDVSGATVLDLEYSADGSMLAGSGTDGGLRLWRTSDWQVMRFLSKGRQASGITLTSNAGLMASTFCAQTGNYGCEDGGVVVWRVSDGVAVYEFDDIAESLTFSPDGSLLVAGSGVQDPVARVRYVADWSLNAVLDGAAQTIAFNPEGTLLVTGDFSTLRFWAIK